VRIALVHYHLRRGGVTSVVYHQAKALIDGGDEVLLIAGEGESGEFRIPCALVEALGYDSNRNIPAEARNLAAGLLEAMKSHWGAAADIVHIHNPLIQKNAALIPALNILNEQGICLLPQIHDLAEDFRPDVYALQENYPENCHYGVINSRDHSFLRRAGLKPEGLHFIPNEVSPVKASEGMARTRYLYPVRAIRRKNIGEALLLSLFIPKGRTIAVTLPPASENDIRIYRRWIAFAEELGLPVEFDIGLKTSLADLFGSSLGIITTSVKEGFGFSYLEAWTAGREVIGRRLEYVCRDFEDAGVRLKFFYSSINIPIVYVSPPSLRRKMERTMRAVYQAFETNLPTYVVGRITEELFSNEVIDFGRLDEEFQENIISALVSNDAARRELAYANPFLGELADWQPDENLIEANRQAVAGSYGKERISGLLKNVYQSVSANPVNQKISKSMLLELYLDPVRLSLVGIGHG
jgi:glycosyltransferase involved in cell wall biosynthesis